jgi:hypothetical protein
VPHRLVAVAVGAEASAAQDDFVGGHHLDRVGALCGSVPTTTGRSRIITYRRVKTTGSPPLGSPGRSRH